MTIWSVEHKFERRRLACKHVVISCLVLSNVLVCISTLSGCKVGEICDVLFYGVT